ncbi:MAG: hypothetical protein DMD49_12730 [Gemmatimonadetes bacterium]|nr:MAG: hypothetical protein DMD49_12730 [Gemmatimonadota bacterium]
MCDHRAGASTAYARSVRQQQYHESLRPEPNRWSQLSLSWRCRGFATEASTALVAFAFASGLVRRVCAHTLPAHGASTRVLAKCGFTFVGDVVDPEDGRVWRWEREQGSQAEPPAA